MYHLCEGIGLNIEWNGTQMMAFSAKCNWCAAFFSPPLSSSLQSSNELQSLKVDGIVREWSSRSIDRESATLWSILRARRSRRRSKRCDWLRQTSHDHPSIQPSVQLDEDDRGKEEEGEEGEEVERKEEEGIRLRLLSSSLSGERARSHVNRVSGWNIGDGRKGAPDLLASAGESRNLCGILEVAACTRMPSFLPSFPLQFTTKSD